jgi:hypothetical protein
VAGQWSKCGTPAAVAAVVVAVAAVVQLAAVLAEHRTMWAVGRASAGQVVAAEQAMSAALLQATAAMSLRMMPRFLQEARSDQHSTCEQLSRWRQHTSSPGAWLPGSPRLPEPRCGVSCEKTGATSVKYPKPNYTLPNLRHIHRRLRPTAAPEGQSRCLCSKSHELEVAAAEVRAGNAGRLPRWMDAQKEAAAAATGLFLSSLH